MITNFRLAKYHFVLEAIDPLYLPPPKGTVLRDGVGYMFKRLACSESYPCDGDCVQGNSCPYSYVFETRLPEVSQVLHNFTEVPRPFIIEVSNDSHNHILPGEQLVFGLILVGHGIQYLPYFVAVFRELGWVGLGHTRGKYSLISVDAISPYDQKSERVYQIDEHLALQLSDFIITKNLVVAYASNLPTDRLTMEFVTPARLKHQGRWVGEGPPFEVLIKSLLGRISSLSYFHCQERLEVDFRELIDRAAHIKITEKKTDWQDWSRFSGRQKQRIEMGGLVGTITYAGDLKDFLLFLALGELVHVGKGAVFGNGKFSIGPVPNLNELG